MLVINLTKQLEDVLAEQSARRGVTPETLALEAIQDRFLPVMTSVEPKDEWERRLFDAAIDCGVSDTDSSLSSEGLYE